MSHRKCTSADPKQPAEEGEIASTSAQSSSNNQIKPNNISATDSGDGTKSTDADLKDTRFKKIIKNIESHLKQDVNHIIMPILESLLKIGSCVEKRDLRFELLENYVRHLQECSAKEVIEFSRITRGMFRSEKLKTLMVDSTSVDETSRMIGKGTFSCIMLGRLKQQDGNKKEVAIKTMNVLVKKYLINEAEVMAHLDHMNIVKIFAYHKGDPDMLIMEYLELGDLTQCIKRQSEISNHQYMKFLHDIASGMEYMTSKKYVHCDLACRNIFVNQNLQCKIGDFGLSQYVGDSDGVFEKPHRGYPIAIAVLPPESRVSQNIKLSWKTDVWAMGILIWEMFTLLEFPLFMRAMVLQQLFLGVKNELPNVGKCPRSLYEYNTSKIMNANPNKRPTFTMIKNKISEMM